MTHKITKKIVGYKVLSKDDVEPVKQEPEQPTLESMNENLTRPEVLLGSTYKIKTPQSEHALYITINDMILNPGTAHEERRPYEIFINSKNMEHFQWVLALTRLISAVFRKGGDACFLVEEMKAVFDPHGG
ncbi:MAG: TSCPD domain-containing protein, partial [Methylobacter sp.]